MTFGSNLQYLRKLNGSMTQEKLAEKMNVSRQTISNWESGDIYPEVEKLIALCDLFSCSLDELVRQDMTRVGSIYSPVRVETVPAFRMARYTVISPEPEDDSLGRMKRWADETGITTHPDYRLIGWDFPRLTQEQKSRFGLRGYTAACVLPEGFAGDCPGAEMASQEAADYAVITIREPFKAPFATIPKAYQLLLDYLHQNGGKENHGEEFLGCFEHEYVKDGVTFMDVYIHAGK